jgi:hypothetical protein
MIALTAFLSLVLLSFLALMTFPYAIRKLYRIPRSKNTYLPPPDPRVERVAFRFSNKLI